jgi:hypothetical protein
MLNKPKRRGFVGLTIVRSGYNMYISNKLVNKKYVVGLDWRFDVEIIEKTKRAIIIQKPLPQGAYLVHKSTCRLKGLLLGFIDSLGVKDYIKNGSTIYYPARRVGDNVIIVDFNRHIMVSKPKAVEELTKYVGKYVELTIDTYNALTDLSKKLNMDYSSTIMFLISNYMKVSKIRSVVGEVK